MKKALKGEAVKTGFGAIAPTAPLIRPTSVIKCYLPKSCNRSRFDKIESALFVELTCR